MLGSTADGFPATVATFLHMPLPKRVQTQPYYKREVFLAVSLCYISREKRNHDWKKFTK